MLLKSFSIVSPVEVLVMDDVRLARLRFELEREQVNVDCLRHDRDGNGSGSGVGVGVGDQHHVKHRLQVGKSNNTDADKCTCRRGLTKALATRLEYDLSRQERVITTMMAAAGTSRTPTPTLDAAYKANNTYERRRKLLDGESAVVTIMATPATMLMTEEEEVVKEESVDV
ncbi:hypothetical protein ONZ45_g19577 [Pleurotus djamor]|nr:hypothetical protein ONZ45_g19577 [Pleurotus djamor]